MRDILEKIDRITLTEWKKELHKLAVKTARSKPSLKDLASAEKSATDDIDSFWVNDAGMIGNLYGIMAEYYSQPFLFHADGSGRASLAQRNKDFPDMYEVVADGSREKDAKSVAKFQNKHGILHPKLVKKFNLDAKDSTPQDPASKVDPGLAKHVEPKTTDDNYATAAGIKTGPKQSIKSGLKLGNVQKMTADDKNIKDLMLAYNNILKKYGSNLRESVLKEEDPELSRTRKMMKGGTLDTPKSPENVEADLAMLQAISDAVQRGFDAGTLSSTQKTNSLIMKMLNDTDRYTAMVKKDANYQDVAYDPTDEYKGLSPTPEPQTAVAQVDPRLKGTDSGIKGDTQIARTADDDTEIRRLARLSGARSKTEPEGGIAADLKNPRRDKRADRASDARNVMSRPVGITTEPKKKSRSQYKSYSGGGERLARSKSQDAIGTGGGRMTSSNTSPEQAAANRREMAKKARFAKLKRRRLGKGETGAAQINLGPRPGQRRNPKITNSSISYDLYGKQIVNELDSIRNLAGLSTLPNKILTEATLNVSLTGNNGTEVAELWQILKGAGIESTVTTYGEPPMEEPTMCPACAAAHGPDTPCGETVEEEWDNAPEEEYQDDEYMLHDLSGGLNRKKERAAQRVKDPAIAHESKFKNQLRNNLEEMYSKLSENDPFAELDRAIASDDMEGDLERQEKLARLKMKKKDRSKADAAHDELSKEMGEASPNDLMKQMKRKTGTGMGGKQHSQAATFAKKTPMKIGPAKAPGAGGVAGALAQGPGTAAAPKSTLSPDTHAMLKSVFPKQYAPERAKRLYDIINQKTGDAMSWLRKKTGKL